MTRTVTLSVTAGLDGSRESRAAAEWAAREAQLLGLPPAMPVNARPARQRRQRDAMTAPK